jgi:threonine synthase
MKEVYFLRCRECGKKYPNQPQSYCEECFSPLEVSYDYEALRQNTSREAVSRRAFNMWRYAEFLPLPQGYTPSQPIGGTPLVKSRHWGQRHGVKNLYFKNDAVNYPTLSFKDRVVATALAAAQRFGFQTIGCSSTGNLANAVAAQGAQQGLDTCVFIPADLEPAKVLNTAVYGGRIIRINGNYDHVNGCARRLQTSSAGDSSTSTCARITPRAQKPTATKSPSSLAGNFRTMLSSQWPAAR